MLYSFGGHDVPSASIADEVWPIPSGDYTNTWFDPHVRFWAELGQWFNLQRQRVGSLRFLEIGVYEGRSAAWLLAHVLKPGDTLICVDPWGPGPEWQPIYDRAMRNVGERAALCRMTSAQFFAGGPNVYDFIYIDGSHKAPDVEADLIAAWPALRPGGIILADDFYNPLTPGEEQREVEAGLKAAHAKLGWPWPPPRWGIDALYEKVV